MTLNKVNSINQLRLDFPNLDGKKSKLTSKGIISLVYKLKLIYLRRGT